jgi:hypothetical protein
MPFIIYPTTPLMPTLHSLPDFKLSSRNLSLDLFQFWEHMLYADYLYLFFAASRSSCRSFWASLCCLGEACTVTKTPGVFLPQITDAADEKLPVTNYSDQNSVTDN